MNKIELSAPTTFGEIIALAAAEAKKNDGTDKQKYFVLLILTDGVITRMLSSPPLPHNFLEEIHFLQRVSLLEGETSKYIDDTTSQLIKGSRLPLSIVIVGVGNEDFDQMNGLVAKEKPLSFNGKTAQREIVQFVPFREYKDRTPAELGT